MKRQVPFLITLVAGIFCLIGFFVPHPAVLAGPVHLDHVRVVAGHWRDRTYAISGN